jgi:type IV pilus assembly protein PilP
MINSTENGCLASARRASESATSASAKYITAMLFALGLSACGGDQTVDLQQYIAEVKARPTRPIPPLPKPEAFETFIYNDSSLRDPFVPTEVVIEAQKRPDNGIRPNLNRERDVLEQYKLGSLKMMGSLEKNGKRWALVRTADGTLHRTTLGRYVGQNNGEIIRITETQMELREIVADGLGGWIEKFTTLAVSE